MGDDDASSNSLTLLITIWHQPLGKVNSQGHNIPVELLNGFKHLDHRLAHGFSIQHCPEGENNREAGCPILELVEANYHLLPNTPIPY